MSRVELPQGIINIQFKKKDGSIRDMRCTIDREIIGKELYDEFYDRTNKDGSPRKQSTTSTSIFDLESKSWKAFINENLISVNGNIINNDIK